MIPPPKNRAFGLLEILISVAIIAILAVALTGAVGSGIRQAKSAGCVHQLRNLGIGFSQYFSDHRHYPVQPADTNDPKAAWPWLVADYLDFNRTTYAPEVFLCPAGIPHPVVPKQSSRGYSMNQMVANPVYGFNRTGPMEQALLVEEWIDSPGTPSHHVMLPTLGAVKNKTYISPSKDSNKTLLAWRHAARMNYLRKDGSAGRSGPGADGWGGGAILWRPVQ